MKQGTSKIVGRGKITSDANYDSTRDSYRNVRSVDWDYIGSWASPGNASTKTLTDITSKIDYVEQLEAVITGEPDSEETVEATVLPGYDRADFLADVFIDESRYDRLRSLLKRKKNVILAGPRSRKDLCCKASGLFSHGRNGSEPDSDRAVPSKLLLRRLSNGIPP